MKVSMLSIHPLGGFRRLIHNSACSGRQRPAEPPANIRDMPFMNSPGLRHHRSLNRSSGGTARGDPNTDSCITSSPIPRPSPLANRVKEHAEYAETILTRDPTAAWLNAPVASVVLEQPDHRNSDGHRRGRHHREPV